MQQTFEYYIVDPGTWKDIKKITEMRTNGMEVLEDLDELLEISLQIEQSQWPIVKII